MISAIIPVHNMATKTWKTIIRLLESADATGQSVEIVIVDDGSRDEERAVLCARENRRVRFVLHDTNRGRSAARNSGACAAYGDQLLFLDCDCLLGCDSFLTGHIRSLRSGVDVSVGAIEAQGEGFWHRYQNEAALRRERSFARGVTYSLTSANMMMNTDCYRKIGGFDEKYIGYGFEDRDFFIRLAEAGANIAYTKSSPVIHDDEGIDLATVMSKMREAGEITAPRFRDDHPSEYRTLGYAGVDARVRPWLAPIGIALGNPLTAIAPRLDSWLSRLPYPVAKAIAKSMTALAFLSGTVRSNG